MLRRDGGSRPFLGAMSAFAVGTMTFAGTLMATSSGAADHETLTVGTPAPDFDLPGIDGRRYSLSSFESAELLVLIFTCNHCPTAQSYEERIIALADDYRGRGVSVVAISPNDPKAVRLDELGYTDLNDTLEEMKVRAEFKGFTFPYLYDGETQSVSEAYGPVATPHVFIFDRERVLRYVGRVDDSEEGVHAGTSHDTRDALEELLAGQVVTTQTTKTFGCSVKWADKREAAQRALAKLAQEEVSLETIDSAGIRALAANDSDNLRLINVWATWCGPCVVEFPDFVEMNRMYRLRGFELVSISADGPAKHAKVLSFLKKQQAAHSNYLFESDDQYALIEAVDENWQGALPYTMLVEPGGRVIYSEQGGVDPLAMKRLIVDRLGREKDW
jgi:peroxiredoxin